MGSTGSHPFGSGPLFHSGLFLSVPVSPAARLSLSAPSIRPRPIRARRRIVDVRAVPSDVPLSANVTVVRVQVRSGLARTLEQEDLSFGDRLARVRDLRAVFCGVGHDG